MPLFTCTPEELALIRKGVKTAVVRKGPPLPGEVAVFRSGTRVVHAGVVRKESGRLTRILRLDNYKAFYPQASSYEEAIRRVGGRAGEMFTAYYLWRATPELIETLRTTADRLNALGLRWAICGTAASHAYGNLCRIKAIDIIVKTAEERELAEQAIGGTPGLRLFDLLQINVGTKGYLFFMDRLMEDFLRHRVLYELVLPVIPVEDNIILQILLWRGGVNRYGILEAKDMITNERVNLPYIRRKVQTFHVEGPVIPLLTMLGLKLEIERFGVVTLE